MRTTLDLSPDILQAARELALRSHKTLGETISELARRGLTGGEEAAEPPPGEQYRNGVPLLPRRPGEIVTLEKVEQLDQETLG